MTNTQSDRLAKAIGHSIALATLPADTYPISVARDVGKAVADVIAQICVEDRMQPFTSKDLDRFLNRVTDSCDATYRRRIEERS
jgi:uncharacterized protein (DUF2267 family)